MNKIFYLLVRFYRVTLSFYLGGNCRYYPSCSCYAEEAYKTHNFFSASKLVAIRLSKCHPLSKAGFYDPVPLNRERV